MSDKRIIKTCVISALSAFMLFRVVFALVYIPTASMEPAIKAGSFGIAWRLPYIINSRKNIERGDIVIFRREGDRRLLCKRVIGLPGETVEIYDGRVYINENVLKEDYAQGYTEGEICITVPPDNLFLLGDNREHSFDSRFWSESSINERRIYARIIAYILR